MKAWVALLAAVAAMPLLAGCSGPSQETPPAVPLGVGGDRLENGTFYAFAHRGGDLAFSVADNGSADVVLYGADDQRIGHIGVGAEQARGRFVLDGVDAGDLVIHALSINGTFDVRSDGRLVSDFRALPLHAERHLLVARDPSAKPLPISVPGSGASVDETLDVHLLRAPSSVAVLAKATYDDLDVTVSGRSGTIYATRSTGNPFSAPAPYFNDLVGDARPENIRDGELTVTVRAVNFVGVLVLEAYSFSRAEPVAGDLHVSSDVPRFTYGELPDQPVSFEVRTGTQVLYLWQEGSDLPEGCEDDTTTEPESGSEAEECAPGQSAHVALFGPDDERIATVAVPANGTLALPVPVAGTWVAVLLDGQATLGADRVPGDFELHPLDTRETTAPSESAGAGGTYGHQRQAIGAQGVPFRVTATSIEGVGTGALPSDPMGGAILGGCDPTSVSVLLDGETIAAWGYGFYRFPAPDLNPIDPALLLGDGVLEVAYDDFGRSCDRAGVVVTSYVR